MKDDNSKATEPPSKTSLTDEQIVTERKLPRRAFLTAAGALVAGGAALAAYGADPDQADRAKSHSGAADADQTDRAKSHSAADADQADRAKSQSGAADADQTDRVKSRSKRIAGAADADQTDRQKSRP